MAAEKGAGARSEGQAGFIWGRVGFAAGGGWGGFGQGHKHTVLGVAWSPDKARLASVSADKLLMLWNAKKCSTSPPAPPRPAPPRPAPPRPALSAFAVPHTAPPPPPPAPRPSSPAGARSLIPGPRTEPSAMG